MESYVAKTLKNYFEKKFEKAENKESLINNALSKTIPDAADNIAPRTQMLYGPSKSEEKDAEKRVNKSGFTLIYDSFSEGLEPIYFWVLDFMRDNYWGTGLEVSKTFDEFEASTGGGFFGDIGTRAAVMQDRATKLIGTINTVVRSIINILYDLKEFDERLDLYKDLKSGGKEEANAARLGLKQIWMDKVDIQRGRGSINMLTQQLQFVTLRDAFMAANTLEDIGEPGKEGGMDLNDRVKRILSPRLKEYLAWEKLSGEELKRRYKIERTYLKSQVESLKLYAQWAKPYLQAARQLKLASSGTADIVNVFNNLQIQVSLFGKKKTSVGTFKTKPEKDYYGCVEVCFNFRSIPHTIRQTQTGTHYTQGGRVEVNFRGFGLNEDEVKHVEEREFFEGLDDADIEGITDETIRQIMEDAKKYLEDEEKEPEDPRERLSWLEELLEKTTEKKVKKEILKKIKDTEKRIKKEGKSPNPFSALVDGIKDMKKLIPKGRKEAGYVSSETLKAAKKDAAKMAYAIYLVFKKAHGMFTE